MYIEPVTVEQAQRILNKRDGDYWVKRAISETLLPAIANKGALEPTLISTLLGSIFFLWSRFDEVSGYECAASIKSRYNNSAKCATAFIPFIEKLSTSIQEYDKNTNNNMEDTLFQSEEYKTFRDTLKKTAFSRSSGKVTFQAFQDDLATVLFHKAEQALLGPFFSSYRQPLQKYETSLGPYKDFVKDEVELLNDLKESYSSLINVNLQPVKSACKV